MMEAVVSTALETFGDLLLEEGKFLSGVGGEVKALQKQLIEIKCLLKDADRRQHESEMVRNWIGEIRDLAYRAEDAIASYAVRISSDVQRPVLKRILHWILNAVISCFSLHQLGQEIGDIKSELASVTKSMQEYGIRSIIDGPENSANENWARKTFPNFEIGDCFVGKEEEVKGLCSLVGDEKQHRVISIWGMGGIGKTTIVKKVYNQMIQANKFDCFAWVCITQQCQIRTILEGVFKQLDPQGVSSLSDEELIMQLCEIQKNKRCLIVVDDLWQISHWDDFKHAFPLEALKSKILVTTRKQNVAGFVGFSIELGLLKMDEALELLRKKSFPHGNCPDFALHESFNKIGKEMVRKCGYLPLAISLLGGVLSKKNSMREWELINANIDSSIYGGEGDDSKGNKIEQVLHLSYQDLPYFLKPCFLSLARLREDESIESLDLYHLWIAQGMVSYENVQRKEEILMETAELYLSELASRCLIQVEVGDDSVHLLKYLSCKLHDVVRDLCVRIGKNENYGVKILEYRDGKFGTLPQEDDKTRHMVMYISEKLQLVEDDHVAIASGEDSKHLRSLEMQHDGYAAIPFPGKNIVDLDKFNMLKSLIITRFKFAEGKFPRGITKFIHLKQLRLEECEIFDELPSSICCLAYLEYLSLFKSWNVRVPGDLNKLSRLKYLCLPLYNPRSIGNYRMRLDMSGELESLMWFNSSVHELVSITRMKNLRLFSAAIHDNASLSTITNIIATEWKKLRYCAIGIEEGCELTREEGQMMLKQVLACPNLYYLQISVPLCKQLAEFESDIISSKLACLTLENCEIEDNPMVILGKLPTLKELWLYSNSFVGEELIFPALSFPNLRNLSLGGLPNWREMRVENGAMPLLREIHFSKCPKFEKIPYGLSSISTLEELRVDGMPELGRRVLESGEDFHKVCHIPKINVSSS